MKRQEQVFADVILSKKKKKSGTTTVPVVQKLQLHI